MKLEKELFLQKELSEAIANNNFSKVRKIINKGVNVNFKHLSKDTDTDEMLYESNFAKAICNQNADILEFLFSKGLIIDEQDKKKKFLPFICHQKCLDIAMKNNFQVELHDVEKWVNFRPILAATACINGIKISQKVCDILMSKLLFNKEYDLIDELITIDYQLPHSIKEKVPEYIQTHALAIEEKKLLENKLHTTSTHSKIKI